MQNRGMTLRWLPIVFDLARADFENLAMARAFKLYAKVAREIAKENADKNGVQTFKICFSKSCEDRLRFQNIYRLNRRPYLSLLDLKEKRTRYARVATNEADLFYRHDHRAGQSKVAYYHTYLQSLALFVEQRHKSQDILARM